jgi:hypothetical protein
MDPRDQDVLKRIEQLGRTIYLRKMQYDKPMLLSIIGAWKGRDPKDFANVVNGTFRLLTLKAQQYEAYAKEKGYTAADLFRYAAVAMLLGKSTWEMSLPQFVLYLMQRGVEPAEFLNISQWVTDFGVLEYKWFSSDKLSNSNANLTPEQMQQAEGEIKRLQDRETFLSEESQNLNETADQLIAEEKTIDLKTFENDMTEVLKGRLKIRSQLLAIKYQKDLLLNAVGPYRLSQQRAAAAAEQKRLDEEKATGVAYCAQSSDFFDPSADLKVGAKTVDPDDGSVSTVISIAVAQDNLLARHCYIREQLAQYFQSKPQIYQWMAPPINAVTPPLQLGMKLYQLPLGNIIITQGGYSRLVNPNNPTTQFFLTKKADNVRMGTLNHTWSAFWDRTEPVYEVVPLLEGNVLGVVESDAKLQEIKIPDEDELDDLAAMEEADTDEFGEQYPALFSDEFVTVTDLVPEDFDDYRDAILLFMDEHDEFQHYPPLTYALQPADSGFLPLNTVKAEIAMGIWRIYQYRQLYRYVRPEMSEAELFEPLNQLQQLYENADVQATEASLPQARQLLDQALRREETFLHNDVDHFVYLMGLAVAIVEKVRTTEVGIDLINYMVESFLDSPTKIINVRTLFARFFEADQDGLLDGEPQPEEEDEPQPDDALNMQE